MTRPLGANQEAILSALRRHGSWRRGCGWVWNSAGETKRYLDNLVSRGLATIEIDHGGAIYRPADPSAIKSTIKVAKFAAVIAQAFDRRTGSPAAVARTETVNLDENPIFKDCKTVLEIKAAYEAFWNDLNPTSAEVVFVQSISFSF